MRPRLIPFVLLWPLLSAVQPVAAQDHPVATAEAVQEAFVSVAEHLRPSVVTIVCETLPKPPAPAAKPGDKKVAPATPPDDGGDEGDDAPFNFSDPTEPRSSLGTGMVVRADGYILTNYHVVKGADVIHVLFNADSEDPDRPLGHVVGYDEESDLAIVKIARKDLTPATFANSSDVHIGEWALAMGAPFDQPLTFTAGVISAKGRHLDKNGSAGLQDYLQTDASINPGNSGGPLVNLAGEVIGVNTAILSPSRFNVGIGFAVPSNTIKNLMPILMTGKSVQRGFLGIQYVRIDDAVAKAFGVAGGMQIGALAKKDGSYIGPAKEAGLREDDIITAVNGEAIVSSDQFRGIVAATPPGKTLKFSVARPEADKVSLFDANVTLGDRNIQMGVATPKPAVEIKKVALGLGLEVENAEKLTASDKSKFALSGKEKGAVITRILPGSPADEGDLRRGLRIVRARVGDVWQNVPDAGTWQKIEKAAPAESSLLLQLRDSTDVSVYKVVVTPEKVATVAVGAVTG